MPVSSSAQVIPQKHRIRKHQGDTWDEFAVIWKQSGSPVDLTGYAASFTIMDRAGGSRIATYTSTDGDLSVDAVGGRVNLNISKEKTALIAPGKYYFDLDVDNGTRKRTLIYGELVVTGAAE